jgi:hypothetical protein
LNGVAAVRWGINHEQNAVNQFALLTEMEVHQTGTHLFPNGILGASPDGLVGDDAVLEVKCPYKESTSNFLESAKNDMAARMNKKKNPYEFCLELKDEKLQLRREHNYYDQLQGSMYATNRNFGYFVVWGTQDFFYEKIPRDPNWGKNISLMEEFYYNILYSRILHILK